MRTKITHPSGGATTNPPPPYQKLTYPKNDVVFSPILQPYNPLHNHNHYRITAANSTPPFTLTSVVSSAISWFRHRRIRYLFLLLCSPLLLVFLFISFPFLCITEFCLRRQLWRKFINKFSGDDSGDRLRRCEEGCCYDDNEEEKGLLHRYLEDQLFLVGSMYDCGNEDEEEEEEDSRRVEFEGSSKTPLLLR
ncbi:unnamed protein product [Trifolium pratense]|uniref:Uncharacterized protein n=1 Tax=Trifolium pratense TaxID=57577 RepID=A0ACB0J3R4_TRIPR|nr:unnamed protein product [Trifolium pratense]